MDGWVSLNASLLTTKCDSENRWSWVVEPPQNMAASKNVAANKIIAANKGENSSLQMKGWHNRAGMAFTLIYSSVSRFSTSATMVRSPQSYTPVSHFSTAPWTLGSAAGVPKGLKQTLWLGFLRLRPWEGVKVNKDCTMERHQIRNYLLLLVFNWSAARSYIVYTAVSHAL